MNSDHDNNLELFNSHSACSDNLEYHSAITYDQRLGIREDYRGSVIITSQEGLYGDE